MKIRNKEAIIARLTEVGRNPKKLRKMSQDQLNTAMEDEARKLKAIADQKQANKEERDRCLILVAAKQRVAAVKVTEVVKVRAEHAPPFRPIRPIVRNEVTVDLDEEMARTVIASWDAAADRERIAAEKERLLFVELGMNGIDHAKACNAHIDAANEAKKRAAHLRSVLGGLS